MKRPESRALEGSGLAVTSLGEALVDFLPSERGARVREVARWTPCLGGAPATRAALRRHLDPAIDAIIVVSEHGGDAPAQGALRLAAAASLSPAL